MVIMFKEIPGHFFYSINENATVILNSSGEVVPEYINHQGKRAVRIRGKSHKNASQPLSRLLLTTFKPLGADKDPDWMSVIYHNGKMDDLRLENIDWSDSWYHPSIIPGVNVPRDTWISVYGHPQVQLRFLNKSVIFRNSRTWSEIGTLVGPQGYLYLNIPGTRTRISVHKAVALTLLPHPIDVDKLVVNHRDSDILHNLPSNLEWATFTRNNFHAYAEGPRSETVRKIRIKSVENGEELVLSGLQELARHVGDVPQGAHQAMDRRKTEGKPYRGYIMKYEDDPRSWEEIIGNKRETFIRPDKVAVKNMYTGEIKVYTNFNELLKTEEIRDFMVFRLLNAKNIIPWRGRCFQRVDKEGYLKWPQYPEEILRVYANTSVSDIPMKVTSSDCDTRYYSSTTEWCEEDRLNRCDPAVLSRYLKKAHGKKFTWRNWTFERVDLSKYPVI